MAYKSFKSLTPRSQSNLVTQLHKLINYYGEIFCPRERSYLKTLTQKDGSIYWLEDDLKKITAVAIVDETYSLKVSNIEVVLVGHTISKRAGQMDRVLHHIWSDYEDKSLAIVCRKNLSVAFDTKSFELIELTPLDIVKYWNELTHLKTSYFNLTNESFVDGLMRKNYSLYIKFTDNDKEILKHNSQELYNCILSKSASQMALQDNKC